MDDIAFLAQSGTTTVSEQIQSNLPLLITGLIILTAGFLVVGVSAFVSEDKYKKRLKEDRSTLSPKTSSGEEIRIIQGVTEKGKLLGPLAKSVMPKNLSEVSALRKALIHAGYMTPAAIGYFYVFRVILALLLPAIALPALTLTAELPVNLIILALISLSGIGLYLPSLWIAMQARSLKVQYLEGFPDALDLLVVCVEAGLGLDAAINRVGKELESAHKALGHNFRIMGAELRAGRERSEVLNNLAERLNIEEARSLVTLLKQSEELGASIAAALRVYSEELREQRLLRAETKAQALPSKLAVPLVLFVFPTVMIVILLPMIIRINQAMG